MSPVRRWWYYLDLNYTDKGHFYGQVLHQALTQKTTGIANTPAIAHLLHETNGYQILYRIAYYGGHPTLNRRTATVSIPRQKSDMSLIAYRKAWEHFLQVHLFMGVIYSDRFFVESFAENLHSMYHKTLCPYLITQVRRLPVDEPVSRDFWPVNILEYLGALCPHMGMQPIDLSATPRELVTASNNRRTTRSSPREQRQLTIRQVDNDPQDSLDFLSGPDYLFVCQLAASGRHCDLCRDPDHFLRDCPHLRELRNDQGACRRLLNAIRDISDASTSRDSRSRGGSSSFSARGRSDDARRSRSLDGTPPASNRSRDNVVRQLDNDDDTVEADDSTIAQLTDDDGTIGYDTDRSEDFLSAGE